MRIGVVDLDTSHPQNWIPIERELGHEVVGIWDEGAVRPEGYAWEFAREFNIPRVFDSLDDMVNEIDCAIVHSCNWDTHIEKARPFVDAGKSVLIDKPIAGTYGDIQQLREWADRGARISGGSSLRFCVESRDWLALPLEERGTPITTVCGCGTDEYNYGIHAYALLSSIMGSGTRSVEYLEGGMQHRIRVNWDDGRVGILAIGTSGVWLPFHATIVSETGLTQFQVDAAKLYRALLEATLPYLESKTDEPPLSFDAWIEPELCALAARRSWLEGNRVVPLEELPGDDEGYDGAAFAREYRKLRSA